jgi:hypothetical protein
MEQIDFSEYKLSKYDMNKLGFLFHKNKDNPLIMLQAITFFGLENLINIKHNGILSKILEYFINKSDEEIINHIISQVDSFQDFKLMKRDYLYLTKYYYQTNLTKSIELFVNNILSMSTHNTEYIIQTKDINFIIENKMFLLITKLNNLFIEASCDFENYVNEDKITYEKKLNVSIDSSVFDIINKNLSSETKLYLESFWSLNNKNYKIIIDGGNVLHSVNGKLNDKSVLNLITIIKQTEKIFGKSLLIVHQKHTKTFPNLINQLKSTGVTYFLTPYNIDDDIFILWFFLNIKSKPFIITNDKYRNHVFHFETINKKDNTNLSMSQFKHVIAQQSLEYNVIQNSINHPVKVSRCIHLIDNKVYIPHILGSFIEINL